MANYSESIVDTIYARETKNQTVVDINDGVAQNRDNGPTNTGLYSPTNLTRVPFVGYPTSTSREEMTMNGPGVDLKVVHAEGNKIAVVTLSSLGKGISSSSTTRYTNPAIVTPHLLT